MRGRALGALLLLAALAAPGRADVGRPAILQKVGVDEHPGAALPLDARLTGADGKPVRLGHYFDGVHPVVLVLGYYRCPMLCSLVIEGAARALAGSAEAKADGARPVFVSIDPRDGPADARAKRAGLGPRGAGWAFLTGPEEETRRIAAAIGFRYAFDRAAGEYAHPAVLVAVAPDGRVSRYLHGVAPDPAAFDAALAGAAEGQAGRSLQEALIECCYRYTPSLRRWAGEVALFLRLGGLLILLAAGGVVAFAIRRARA